MKYILTKTGKQVKFGDIIEIQATVPMQFGRNLNIKVVFEEKLVPYLEWRGIIRIEQDKPVSNEKEFAKKGLMKEKPAKGIPFAALLAAALIAAYEQEDY